MTTVVNPNSTPTVVYNQSGTTVVSVAAGIDNSANPTSANASSIPDYSGHIVALLSPPSSWNQSGFLVVILPSSKNIGDIVEAYSVIGFYTGPNPAEPIIVFPPVGESFNNLSANTGTNTYGNVAVTVSPGHGIIFRKVSSTNWQGVGT